MTFEDSGNYWFYAAYFIPMEVGTNSQTLNFLFNPSYFHETMVVLTTNTGNCTVPTKFDATAGGVTLGTTAVFPVPVFWEMFIAAINDTAEAHNITTQLKFAGQTIPSANIKAISKFNCDMMVTGGAGINWDGVVSLTGVNNGQIPGFIVDLDSFGTWSTKKISLYISSTSKYLDFNNVDSAQIDSGGPWQITNKVNNFF